MELIGPQTRSKNRRSDLDTELESKELLCIPKGTAKILVKIKIFYISVFVLFLLI